MPRLLVIDDSLTVRKVVELSFRNSAWLVDFAANGADGVAAAARFSPDVILLDYVLPDMKATEVCRRLAGGRNAGTPIILMSGNLEKVRDFFKEFRSVVDSVAKPFTTEAIVSRIEAAAARAKQAAQTARPESVFSFAQRQAGANALFAHLRTKFAQIPEWAAQLGASSPAQFFARKILTPDLMADLLEALLPIYRELLGATPEDTSATEADHDDVAFQGQLAAWPIRDLLQILDTSGRTGEFRIESGSQTTILYVRRGEIVLVTCLDPSEYTRDSAVELGGVSTAAKLRAGAEQQASGRPLYIGLGEAGELPRCDMAALLCEQGKRLLLLAIEQTRVRFAWRERDALPLYVDAYGRPISLEQLPLETLRRQRPLAQAERMIPVLDVVFQRTEGFTRKLRRLDLTSPERLVLAFVDGRNATQDVIDRSGLETTEVVLILHRLAEVGLVQKRGPSAVDAENQRPRPIMILEPDVEGFRRPLAGLLRSRANPVELIDLDDDADPLAAILKVRPCVVILNASAAGSSAVKTARAVRATPELTDLPLVAIVDVHRAAQADQLAAAGFDAVLSKPVRYSDIERLLVA
jgi:CheY-like chemotaxis protein